MAIIAIVAFVIWRYSGSGSGSRSGSKYATVSDAGTSWVADGGMTNENLEWSQPIEHSIISQVDTLGRAIEGLEHLHKGRLNEAEMEDGSKGVFSIHQTLEDAQLGTRIQRGGAADSAKRGLQGDVNALVYSGDLITLVSRGGQRMILKSGEKNVSTVHQLDNTTPDHLFKLRLELADGHSELKRVPIMYGDSIRIAYNDDDAQTVYLNHQGDLNVLKNSQIYFKLVGVGTNSRGQVQYGQKFNIMCIRGAGESSYLRVDTKAGKIHTNSGLPHATVFRIDHKPGCGPLWRLQ